MFAPILQSFQPEDVILFVWLGFVEPLLARLLTQLIGNAQPWTIGAQQNVLLGLVFIAAGLGGAAVIATRAPGQSDPTTDEGNVSNYARLPMLVTLGYMFLYGTSALGLTDDKTFGLVACFPILLIGVTAMLFKYLPTLSVLWRRLLVTPLILLGTWNFSAVMQLMFGNADLRQTLPSLLVPSLQNPDSSLALVTGLLGAAVVFFYLVFVLAPRQIAFPNGSWREWLIRFGLFGIGLVFNISFLRV
jgi:hypothetical protein